MREYFPQTPSELRAAFTALAPHSTGTVTRDGVECTVFDLSDVSYYPCAGELKTMRELEKAGKITWYESPLANTPVEGTIELCPDGRSYLARLAICEIHQRDSEGHGFTPFDLPEEAVGDHTHTVSGISPSGEKGHVFTIDPEGSEWTICIKESEAASQG